MGSPSQHFTPAHKYLHEVQAVAGKHEQAFVTAHTYLPVALSCCCADSIQFSILAASCASKLTQAFPRADPDAILAWVAPMQAKFAPCNKLVSVPVDHKTTGSMLGFLIQTKT
jgi:hypothetical protein